MLSYRTAFGLGRVGSTCPSQIFVGRVGLDLLDIVICVQLDPTRVGLSGVKKFGPMYRNASILYVSSVRFTR